VKTETKSKSKKWSEPGPPLSIDEFRKGIKESESGLFFSIKQSKETLKQWKKRGSSK
jgi:hypothetical protein